MFPVERIYSIDALTLLVAFVAARLICSHAGSKAIFLASHLYKQGQGRSTFAQGRIGSTLELLQYTATTLLTRRTSTCIAFGTLLAACFLWHRHSDDGNGRMRRMRKECMYATYVLLLIPCIMATVFVHERQLVTDFKHNMLCNVTSHREEVDERRGPTMLTGIMHFTIKDGGRLHDCRQIMVDRCGILNWTQGTMWFTQTVHAPRKYRNITARHLECSIRPSYALYLRQCMSATRSIPFATAAMGWVTVLNVLGICLGFSALSILLLLIRWLEGGCRFILSLPYVLLIMAADAAFGVGMGLAFQMETGGSTEMQFSSSMASQGFFDGAWPFFVLGCAYAVGQGCLACKVINAAAASADATQPAAAGWLPPFAVHCLLSNVVFVFVGGAAGYLPFLDPCAVLLADMMWRIEPDDWSWGTMSRILEFSKEKTDDLGRYADRHGINAAGAGSMIWKCISSAAAAPLPQHALPSLIIPSRANALVAAAAAGISSDDDDDSSESDCEADDAKDRRRKSSAKTHRRRGPSSSSSSAAAKPLSNRSSLDDKQARRKVPPLQKRSRKDLGSDDSDDEDNHQSCIAASSSRRKVQKNDSGARRTNTGRSSGAKRPSSSNKYLDAHNRQHKKRRTTQ